MAGLITSAAAISSFDRPVATPTDHLALPVGELAQVTMIQFPHIWRSAPLVALVVALGSTLMGCADNEDVINDEDVGALVERVLADLDAAGRARASERSRRHPRR